MKVALVYDRVNKWGGAERVLLALHELFPDAPLYTSVYHPQKATWAEVFPRVIPSFLQNIYFLKDKHELIPFMMPLAFESLDLKKYDLVISVTSEAAKGVITNKNTYHICYCLTPTRYLWSNYDDYFQTKTFKTLTKPLVSYMRKWDLIAAERPDEMVAISKEVKKRIKKYYKRNSNIIYPPIDLRLFKNSNRPKKENFYLVVSRLVPYKKVDLVIKTFNDLKLPLVIIGSGREESKLKKLANKNIKFEKNLEDRELINYYKRAKALIFPQEEDFGLTAVEATAMGTPVIAFQKGGSKDIVIDRVNGIFFKRQNQKSLIESIYNFEKVRLEPREISESAKRFSKSRFKEEFLKLIK